tara:strand:- start:769 stop:933 length:165 start_codon:yes stop_codon:yes gene_type:complete
MSGTCGEKDRIEAMDVRLRSVESAIIELGALSRYAKYGLLVLAAGLGFDLQGMV